VLPEVPKLVLFCDAGVEVGVETGVEAGVDAGVGAGSKLTLGCSQFCVQTGKMNSMMMSEPILPVNVSLRLKVKEFISVSWKF
jgi:hypothetical protein